MKSEIEIIERIKDALLDADSVCFDEACKQQDNGNFCWLMGFGSACVACFRALAECEPGIIKEVMERYTNGSNK